MGQLIDEDDCEVCVPFDQEWIFTYGDLVTLLLCFFILLFSMCKIDVEKISDISQSFKSLPPGSPFVHSGKSSTLDKAAKDIQQLEMPDDVTVNASNKGVEVTFKETIAFEVGSVELTEKAKKALAKMMPVVGSLPNDILISGHTDETDRNPQFPSNWEMSTARASAIANYLEAAGIRAKRIQVAGFGNSRPRFFGDTAYKRALNRRVEVLLLPEDYNK